MNQINTIYLSYDGMTDPLGQSQVLPYLIGLSKAGYHIHLISCEKKERYDQKRELITSLLKNSSITWHPIPYHSKPPVLSTLYDLYRMQKKVQEVLSKNKISLLHCRSYITALIGLQFKRNNNIPFIFDMRGFWADERVDGKIWNLKKPLYNFIYKYFKKKEKEFMAESARIISLTHKGKEEILTWELPVKKNISVDVIPCCADFKHFSIEKITEQSLLPWKKRLGLVENDFVISYVGSLGTWYMLPQMMDFIKTASEKIAQLKFLIITTDAPQFALKAAKDSGVDHNQIIVMKADREEVPFLIALSNFSMFFIQPAYSKMASSPTKLAEILGMGIPVLCNSNVGDVESIVNKGNAGVVIQSFNREVYQAAIDKMLQLLPADKFRLAAYAKKYASLDEGINTYTRVYREIAVNQSE
jgi:glycosyltransferase involved in cell wall biosynthesis